MTKEKKNKNSEPEMNETRDDQPATGKEKENTADVREKGVKDNGEAPTGHKKDKKKDKIKELETKLDEFTDRHLRLQAEFDNFRRRTVKEKAELIKSGGETVLTGILPIIDDFERAIDSMKEVADDDAGKQGTLLIYSKFKDFLKQNNVKEIDALHHEFDVDHHEALTKIPAPEKKLKGKVVDVIQKGYMLNDKVIRFAKVVVGE